MTREDANLKLEEAEVGVIPLKFYLLMEVLPLNSFESSFFGGLFCHLPLVL